MAMKVFHVCLPEDLVQRLQTKADTERKDLDLLVVDLLEYALKTVGTRPDRFLSPSEKGLKHPRWLDPPVFIDDEDGAY